MKLSSSSNSKERSMNNRKLKPAKPANQVPPVARLEEAGSYRTILTERTRRGLQCLFDFGEQQAVEPKHTGES